MIYEGSLIESGPKEPSACTVQARSNFLLRLAPIPWRPRSTDFHRLAALALAWRGQTRFLSAQHAYRCVALRCGGDGKPLASIVPRKKFLRPMAQSCEPGKVMKRGAHAQEMMSCSECSPHQ
jgi:hypothetical protein